MRGCARVFPQYLGSKGEECIEFKKELKKGIIGQEEAVLLLQMQSGARTGIIDAGRPWALFFLGPTGVGKTELRF